MGLIFLSLVTALSAFPPTYIFALARTLSEAPLHSYVLCVSCVHVLCTSVQKHVVQYSWKFPQMKTLANIGLSIAFCK